MELDFSANCTPQPKVIVARTPPAAGFMEARPRPVDEYVDMSPRNAGFIPTPIPNPTPINPTVPDGYVEMNYTRAPTRPIAITRPPPPSITPTPTPTPVPVPSPPRREPRTPLGSQTIFPLSLDSPASPPEIDAAEVFDDDSKADEASCHPLSTVREISEEGRRSPTAPAAASPQYVRLAAPAPGPERGTTVTTVVVAGAAAKAARFSIGDEAEAASTGSSPAGTDTSPGAGGAAGPRLHYAALDLQPRRAAQPTAARAYTQIDFLLSEKLRAADAT
ncbi:hypothetical protein ACJJTC_005679 [Scirpophaga incertulas]